MTYRSEPDRFCTNCGETSGGGVYYVVDSCQRCPPSNKSRNEHRIRDLMDSYIANTCDHDQVTDLLHILEVYKPKCKNVETGEAIDELSHLLLTEQNECGCN